jgi:hypothetical protein
MTTLPRATQWALIAVLGGLPACLLPSGGDTETDPSGSSTGSTGEPTTGAPTTLPPVTTEPDETTSTDPTTEPEPECGNAIQEDGEQCDNGTDNADDAACRSDCQLAVCGDGLVLAGVEACDDGNADASDDCITCVDPEGTDCPCKLATCGDGFLQEGVEVCDDGVNDGGYGSCTADCAARGPYCGDGNLDVDGGEECDDAEDPACLVSCKLATSCLLLHEAQPALMSGPAVVYPLGPDTPIAVYCDMDSDGGGYTFLKVDVDSDTNDLPYTAKKAEMTCAEYGMRLLVPRSPAHLASAYGIATIENLAPVGGGSKGAGPDYLQILGIYPETADTSCVGMPLTPDDCPEWIANDEEDWYVSDVVKNASEPDPDGACAGCSMVYTWNGDGTVKSYKTIPGTGGTSLRFFCDVGDKLP